MATSAVSIVSGWPTAVVATEAVLGLWDTGRPFCIAVIALTAVVLATTTAGVVLLLLRRQAGPPLIVAGSFAALLTFIGIALAGTPVPGPVYLLAGLPAAGLVLALLPATRRWAGNPR